MARMSDLMIDVEEMLRAGFSTEETAKALGVPFDWVKEVKYACDAMDFPENDQFETCNFVEVE